MRFRCKGDRGSGGGGVGGKPEELELSRPLAKTRSLCRPPCALPSTGFLNERDPAGAASGAIVAATTRLCTCFSRLLCHFVTFIFANSP